MSGIVGVLDRSGPDPAAIERAAGHASYRGPATVLARGPVALGVLGNGSDSLTIESSPSTLLVADRRVDGRLSAPFSLEPGEDLLDKTLSRTGPAGLMALAAEFSLARYDTVKDELLLARDAFALRPLFLARRGAALAFASDPAILVAMGFGSWELDLDRVRSFLAGRDEGNEGSPFCGIETVGPGAWRTFDQHGRHRSGRWFEPECLAGPDLDQADAVDAVRETVRAAVRSRVEGARRVGLTLSAGRDSGSLAVALHDLGVQADCLTQRFDEDLGVDESGPARSLARAFGHRCVGVDVTSAPTRAEFRAIPSWAGTPCAYPGFPQATAPVAAASDLGIDMLLGGDGGEPLFSAAPIVVADLVRLGRLSDAIRAAHVFNDDWTYPYATIAKAVVRALLPRAVLQGREQLRPAPPWVRRPPQASFNEITAPRSARRHLIAALRGPAADAFEIEERIHQRFNVRASYPLLDLRVVRVALSVPSRLRAPVPEPKPLLAQAFLGRHSIDRKKMTFGPYYNRLARSAWTEMPEIFTSEALVARRGLVDAASLLARRADWKVESLRVVPVEMWLQAEEA